MTLDEQHQELAKLAMESALTAAGKYLDKSGLYDKVDNKAVIEQVKEEVANEYNSTLEDCQDAELMGGQYMEFVFEANMTEAGIDAAKKIENQTKEVVQNV